MTDEEIMRLLREAFVESGEAKSDVGPLHKDQKLSDLGFDSMSALSLAGFMEERLGVTFADSALARVTSIGDFVALIRSTLREAT